MAGFRRRDTGGVMEGRDLEQVGKDVDRLLERMGMPPAVDLSMLVERWSELVGEAIGEVSRPVLLEGTELTVDAADGPTASLLKYRIGPLLDALREHLGEGVVEAVKIRVARRKKPL